MTADDRIALLREMILIRTFDENALRLLREGKVYGTSHPYTGQEAVAVGVCATLRPSDRIVSHHRGHGHLIAKGGDIQRMMAELFGRRDGYCRGHGGSMHIASFDVGVLGANGIVGAGLPIAVGSALASRLRGEDDVTVSFFGDGATGEGAFHEALNLASVWKLPVLFVCENNLYARDVKIDTTLGVADVATFAGSYAMPGEVVDGNDVLAVRRTAAQLVDRMRAGGGPALLEAKTYRWGLHSQRSAAGVDKRPAEEVAHWKARDPIAMLERTVLDAGLMDAAGLAALRAEVDADVAAAIAYADASPFPEPRDALSHLFAEPVA